MEKIPLEIGTRPQIDIHFGKIKVSGGTALGDSELGRTFILQDEDGTEMVGILVDKEVVFTATENDIRKGTIAATSEGVTTGAKEIPAYHTSEGFKVIPNGSDFILRIKNYDYTKLQAVFCPYNKTSSNSVAVEKTAINNNVYPVESTIAESEVTINAEDVFIDFGITNDSGNVYLIRYFSYKEIQ